MHIVPLRCFVAVSLDNWFLLIGPTRSRQTVNFLLLSSCCSVCHQGLFSFFRCTFSTSLSHTIMCLLRFADKLAKDAATSVGSFAVRMDYVINRLSCVDIFRLALLKTQVTWPGFCSQRIITSKTWHPVDRHLSCVVSARNTSQCLRSIKLVHSARRVTTRRRRPSRSFVQSLSMETSNILVHAFITFHSNCQRCRHSLFDYTKSVVKSLWGKYLIPNFLFSHF